ncbi:MAG: aldo/keto reductase [Thioalkalivibrio sp.]|nr:aldo/keto reductase [Thioalkalivibrio sp.]
MPLWPAATNLPGTTRSVRRMGLGAMHLSLANRPDRDDAVKLIRHAVEQGVELIDTADAYAIDDDDIGHNERLIGDALREMGLDPGAGLEDGTPLVATKGGRTRPQGRWAINGRPEHLRAACHRSLKALGVERIALYQLHTPDPQVPFSDSVGALARLQEEGKVGLVGLSNVSPAQIDEALETVAVASVQNALSAWDTGFRRPPVVTRCAEAGILFMAHSPLGGSGRAAALGEAPELAALANALDTTPQELALAWLLKLDPVVVPIPGTGQGAGRIQRRPMVMSASSSTVRMYSSDSAS